MIPGFKGRNHPHQVKRRGALDDVDDRQTHPELVRQLAELCGGPFTLDAAAAAHNTQCERFNSLAEPTKFAWAGERVWCNPPYSGIPHWVVRGWEERETAITCMLLPANRTEQPWWQHFVEPYRDGRGTLHAGRSLDVSFIRKRWPFLSKGQTIGNSTSKNPPFGLVALIWSPT